MKLFCKIFLFFLFPLSLGGCAFGNYTNIQIVGIVKDSLNNRPIINATVHTKCWVYSTKTWESDTISKVVKTDFNGKFQVFFEKGEAVDIFISATNYQSKEISKTLKRNKLELETYLQAN